jgi:hypothetical protein
MSDPWSTLIDSLSGTERTTPKSWPARKVHRMADDSPPARLQKPAERAPQMKAQRAVLAQWPGASPRLQCPCTACALGLQQPPSAT